MIVFEYRDRDGVVSMRRLDDLEADEIVFHGFDQDAGAKRTFRRDQVLRWIEGSEADLDAARSYEPVRRGAAGVGFVNVTLTGHAKTEKTRLEALAASAGFIVRASVSQAITYLCVGPNAGPLKIARAKELGARILTPAEFEAIAAAAIQANLTKRTPR